MSGGILKSWYVGRMRVEVVLFAHYLNNAYSSSLQSASLRGASGWNRLMPTLLHTI